MRATSTPLRSTSWIACSALVAAALVGCAAPAARDALRERWHSDARLDAYRPETETWLELATPADGTRLEAVVPLVDVRGRAGAGAHGPQDVVLAIDTSGSVFQASGIDLDGDGIVGA